MKHILFQQIREQLKELRKQYASSNYDDENIKWHIESLEDEFQRLLDEGDEYE